MYSDGRGHFAISALIVGLIIGVIGARVVNGAIEAYESSKALNKSGWETFGWTLSGLLVGNAGVVAANWDQVIHQPILKIIIVGLKKIPMQRMCYLSYQR